MLFQCTNRYCIGIGIGRYIGYRPIIGFADMKISYQYRLSVSADTKPHIGNLTDMLNWAQRPEKFKNSKKRILWKSFKKNKIDFFKVKFPKLIPSFFKKNIISVIGIDIGHYRKFCISNLSVSADIKIGFIGDYRSYTGTYTIRWWYSRPFIISLPTANLSKYLLRY